jgi:hypothetical protein
VHCRECAAAVGEDGVEVLQGGEVAVGDRLVEEGPEPRGQLQLGAVGRQEFEADAVGHDQVGRSMPAGVV